jgi:DnaJ-class molecular chaperone
MQLIDALRVLDLGFDADVHAVKQAYRTLAFQVHPDTSVTSNEQFALLNDAYRLALAWAQNAPCPHCVKGKVQLVRGISVLNVPCTFCKGSGRRG